MLQHTAAITAGMLKYTLHAGGNRMRTPLEVLNDTRVAAPCSVSWHSMRGDSHARHCDRCDRKVFNLSSLSATDAVALLDRHGYDLCVRLYKRRDGTVMTKPCGERATSHWKWMAWAASLFASLSATGCATATQGMLAHPEVAKQHCENPSTKSCSESTGK